MAEMKSVSDPPLPEVEEALYINKYGKWIEGQAPQRGDQVVHRVRKTFGDIWWYYANLIDYFRCILGVAALVVILYFPAYKLTIGAMIMSNVLLDWIDGPIARAYNQSSVMGCGWDWLADILAQYNLAIWCMQLNNYIAPYVILFSAVEFGTGLFDFAISAMSIYPSQNPDHTPWYFIVENWLTPGGSYNHLGTSCWLINTIFPIAVCIDAPEYICNFLAPFAYLYAWHEVSQFFFIVGSWKETTASFQVGVNYQRSCEEPEKKLIKETYDCVSKFLDLTSTDREIVWGNLYVDGKVHPDFISNPLCKPFDDFVKDLVKEMYHDDREILSYGFILSPKNGTKSQNWHHDYSCTVSNLLLRLLRIMIAYYSSFRLM
jgi:hypothetical protein